MRYEQIRATLNDVVGAIVGLPTVSAENTITKPVAGQAFTRTTLLPARPTQLTVGVTGKDELTGLFQVDLYYPLGSGATAAMEAADLVVSTFPRSWVATVDGYQLRVAQSWAEAGREVNGWYVVSVVLTWSVIR